MTAPTPDPSPLRPATTAVTAGRPAHEPDSPLNPPLVLASTYVAGGETEYGRYGNPTWQAFEEALGRLEGGRALAFSSGLAAANTVLDLVAHGETVVAPRHCYLGTLAQLADMEQRGRVAVRLVDVTDTEGVIRACEDAALLWLESPTNPAMEVADIEAIAHGAHEAGVTVVVDNTFATPLLQRPLDLGADVVVHSVSKFLAGHSDVVLGALVTRQDSAYDAFDTRRRGFGAIPGPFETWLALRGMRTLALRVERGQANAQDLVARLRTHPAVEEVRYPGFGAMVAVVVRGGAAAADTLTRSTSLWVHATSLGGVESSLERRRRWSGEPESIPEGLVRLSVGIEDVEDLWDDLSAALKHLT
ncbi:MAG TPA: aminotransferase class I/II-fold pyridoxal phosphate-dependent enzyme [Nocardioidaceae bacterium]|nr:aminotransferase class I/II-fold pyridoxal phosphate-dependent enzyme [Nocardioidaceae bacterium]